MRHSNLGFRRTLRLLAVAGAVPSCLVRPEVYFGSNADGVGAREVGAGDATHEEQVDGGSPSAGGAPSDGGGLVSTGGAYRAVGGTGSDRGHALGGLGGDVWLLPAIPPAVCPTQSASGGGTYDFPPPGCPCHEGPLYEQVPQGAGTYGYFPVECFSVPESYALGNVCSMAGNPQPVYPCDDLGHGFTRDARFVENRSDGDAPVLYLNIPGVTNLWNQNDDTGFEKICHAGGVVIGTYECGQVPVEHSVGGKIVPGRYALTSIIQYGTPTFRIAGNHFWQTLLVTDRSMAVLSDDGATLRFKGAYLYATNARATIYFQPVSPVSDMVPWTRTAVYTATERRLEIFAPTEGYVATFERVD